MLWYRQKRRGESKLFSKVFLLSIPDGSQYETETLNVPFNNKLGFRGVQSSCSILVKFEICISRVLQCTFTVLYLEYRLWQILVLKVTACSWLFQNFWFSFNGRYMYCFFFFITPHTYKQGAFVSATSVTCITVGRFLWCPLGAW